MSKCIGTEIHNVYSNVIIKVRANKKNGEHESIMTTPQSPFRNFMTKLGTGTAILEVRSQEPGAQSWSRLIHLRFMTLSHRQRNSSPPHKPRFPWKT